MKILALMGKAGSGKDTILRKLVESYPDRFHEIISCTTRPPREGEVDGRNYHFLEVCEFLDEVHLGNMLESTKFNGWYYGTAKSALSQDKVNIGVFNPEGIRSLMEHEDIDLETYHIVASDKERLIRQLTREKEPNIDEIIRRYVTDKIDFENLWGIPCCGIKNEEPEDLDKIVRALGNLI